jgi:hypothetical protein
MTTAQNLIMALFTVLFMVIIGAAFVVVFPMFDTDTRIISLKVMLSTGSVMGVALMVDTLKN